MPTADNRISRIVEALAYGARYSTRRERRPGVPFAVFGSQLGLHPVGGAGVERNRRRRAGSMSNDSMEEWIRLTFVATQQSKA